MFTLTKDATIHNRVMKVVKERIATAQDKYNTCCVEVDEDCDRKIEVINSSRDEKKEKHADNLVNEILTR